MKIRKYYAKDMREALNKVRDEQGPDAVILENRKINGGIELLAADDYQEPDSITPKIDLEQLQQVPLGRTEPRHEKIKPTPISYEEVASRVTKQQRQQNNSNNPLDFSQLTYKDKAIEQLQNELLSVKALLQEQMSALAWGDMGKAHPLWAGLLRRLGRAGIHASLSRSLVEQIPQKMDMDKAWRMVMAYLSYRVRIENAKILTPNHILAFVGQSGVGKTTSIAKLATRYVTENNNKDIILATTDSYRVGGRDQLKNYARILGVSFQAIDSNETLSSLIENNYGEKLILIDTAGIPVQEKAYCDQLALMLAEADRIKTCLVVAANSQIPSLKSMPKAFRSLTPEISIITKLDETFSLGDTLSTLIEENLKIAYCCNGQKVHGDIFKPESHQLVSQTINTMNHHSEYITPDEQIEQEYGEFELTLTGQTVEHQTIERYEN